MSNARNGWIKDALQKRGYKQRDLARNWSVAEGSVSRFISGEENQNLVLSKAVTLSKMLGISVDDLAKGLGMDGKVTQPEIPPGETPTLPPGSLTMEMIGGGKIRLTMCQDLPADAAAQVMTLLAATKS